MHVLPDAGGVSSDAQGAESVHEWRGWLAREGSGAEGRARETTGEGGMMRSEGEEDER